MNADYGIFYLKLFIQNINMSIWLAIDIMRHNMEWHSNFFINSNKQVYKYSNMHIKLKFLTQRKWGYNRLTLDVKPTALWCHFVNCDSNQRLKWLITKTSAENYSLSLTLYNTNMYIQINNLIFEMLIIYRYH